MGAYTTRATTSTIKANALLILYSRKWRLVYEKATSCSTYYVLFNVSQMELCTWHMLDSSPATHGRFAESFNSADKRCHVSRASRAFQSNSRGVCLHSWLKWGDVLARPPASIQQEEHSLEVVVRHDVKEHIKASALLLPHQCDTLPCALSISNSYPVDIICYST